MSLLNRMSDKQVKFREILLTAAGIDGCHIYVAQLSESRQSEKVVKLLATLVVGACHG